MLIAQNQSGVETPLAKSFAIQGELGSNSHAAALAVAARSGVAEPNIVPCAYSSEVIRSLLSGAADVAVLPIENSLHGSVAEHYDLLLEHDVRITGESLQRIHHNVIAVPGVRLDQVREVLSHPVALSQCRQWLAAHPLMRAVPFYDTAGSVKHLMESGLRYTAGLAPALAASQYGAEILVEAVEDHPENFTRFFRLERASDAPLDSPAADKLSLAFTLEHRPGTLLAALDAFADAGLNLTRIESRPVPGRPWEYVFFVDLRFTDSATLPAALARLGSVCQRVKELGRYVAA